MLLLAQSNEDDVVARNAVHSLLESEAGFCLFPSPGGPS